MLRINARVTLAEHEWQMQAVRAQGAGGQNVNKVANAAHLRFDIPASSLPEAYKARLLALRDRRISADGVLVIKAQRFRSLEQNQADALARLKDLVLGIATPPKVRRPTAPTRAAQTRRLDEKARHARLKALRQKPME
ncbi:MAG: alternative ribosome rescue aminoacyl-tRNA hydrolase ArfB [Gammaproteobacteria bacterium]